MSSFLRPNGFMVGWHLAPMRDADQPQWRWNEQPWRLNPQISPWEPGLLWSKSRMIAGDRSAVLALTDDPSSAGEWGPWPKTAGGAQSLFKITGVAKDNAGNPLSGVTVQGFMVVDGVPVFVRECVSGVDGSYDFRTPFPLSTTYRLVSYKAGSPDLAGTTVNTLLAS